MVYKQKLQYLLPDRKEAGKLLAKNLQVMDLTNPVILALPRGGVPVGYEIAKILHAPLETIIVRKLGAPINPEFGFGALAEDNTVFLDERLIEQIGISHREIQQIIDKEKAEIARRVVIYREGRVLAALQNATAILVDDGLATGVTASAAIKAIERLEPLLLIFASPVCAKVSSEELSQMVDGLVCIFKPQTLQSIGQYYEDFRQISDVEVVRLLRGGEIMAHVSADAVQIIWDHLYDFSWSGLREALNEFYAISSDESTGINSRTIDTLVAMTWHLERKNEAFPKSADELYQVMNANFGFQDELRQGV